MLVQQALKQILADNSGVFNLVGARVYPGKLPQNVTDPAIAYRLMHRRQEPVLTSRTSGPTRSDFIFYCVVPGTAGAKPAALIEEAVRLCLQGYAGTVTLDESSPPEMIRIDGIFLKDSDEIYDDKTQTYQVASIYTVHHAQVDPTQ